MSEEAKTIMEFLQSEYFADLIKGNDFRNMTVTVLAGVGTFILSQVFLEFCMRPFQEYKKLRAKVAYSLVYYANLYGNPVPYADESCNKREMDNRIDASRKMRGIAAEVAAFVEMRPFVLTLFRVPSKNTLKDVSQILIGISNSFFDSSDIETRGSMRADIEFIQRAMRIQKRW